MAKCPTQSDNPWKEPALDPLPTAPGWLLSRHVGEAPLAVGFLGVWEEEEREGDGVVI